MSGRVNLRWVLGRAYGEDGRALGFSTSFRFRPLCQEPEVRGPGPQEF